MPYRHALQTSRFELKYIVGDKTALGIRDFLRSHLEPDEHAEPDQGNAYRISSLYLDTPALTLFNQTVQGMKNRFKLRIRFYDDDPNGPAFLEIKRRITDVIRKERAAIRRDGVRYLLEGGWPDASYLMDSNGSVKSASALQHFCNLCDGIGAEACIYVSYIREAYVLPDSDQVRVTLDRQLFGSPYRRTDCLLLPAHGVRPEMGGVILELKFTDRFPNWMRDLVQAFNLQRRSVPKYIDCVKALGMHRGERLGVELGMTS